MISEFTFVLNAFTCHLVLVINSQEKSDIDKYTLLLSFIMKHTLNIHYFFHFKFWRLCKFCHQMTMYPIAKCNDNIMINNRYWLLSMYSNSIMTFCCFFILSSCEVAKAGMELGIFLPRPLSAEITGTHHHSWFHTLYMWSI
jgi:hypothetical protein